MERQLPKPSDFADLLKFKSPTLHVIGHSLGAIVAAALGRARSPDRDAVAV